MKWSRRRYQRARKQRRVELERHGVSTARIAAVGLTRLGHAFVIQWAIENAARFGLRFAPEVTRGPSVTLAPGDAAHFESNEGGFVLTSITRASPSP